MGAGGLGKIHPPNNLGLLYMSPVGRDGYFTEIHLHKEDTKGNSNRLHGRYKNVSPNRDV